MQKLPDAEFLVMKAIWAMPAPVTASQVYQALDAGKKWRVQTVITLLQRLVERGFLFTEKRGRERIYTPLIDRAAYLQFESEHFMQAYHGNSVSSLVTSLSGGKTLSDADAHALLAWLQERMGKQ